MEVKVVNIKKCEKQYKHKPLEGVVCVDNPQSKKFCAGLFGTPLFCDGKLVGIYSTFKPCYAKPALDMYTLVNTYSGWMERSDANSVLTQSFLYILMLLLLLAL